MEKEIWKDIPNYVGEYQASNLGRVKSLDRVIYNSGNLGLNKFSNLKGKILKQSFDDKGYNIICLKGKTISVHKLVAITFLNHTPDKHNRVVDHIDNVKTNNNVNNLQIITTRENTSKDIKNVSSKYTGVHYCNKRNKWIAQINLNKKRYSLGRYDDEEYAAKLYIIALENEFLHTGNNKEFKKLIKKLAS